MPPAGCSITALLGPTNTGKTHRAVEQMLGHDSGMIGLPLRLLAREIFDRVSERVGENQVALVTGEEKRIPRRPRYWVCTVEAMPTAVPVDFLAVDEIQLAAHHQRGHVFTDRLLHARGERETCFLGSDTMRSIVAELLPTAQVRSHPRFSRLSAVGAAGLAALPPRSAVIAFSTPEVYQLADRLRRRKGGAAVVLGALSPRTRNAQVAMYQAGEVDYLVATDAIGMGLNLDVDHVAFASLDKFDGRRSRALAAAEVAQIAGRAGRHVRDGTFGAVAPLAIPPDLGFAVEQHRFAPVRRLVWRNHDLDPSSVDALVRSLTEPPRRRILQRVEHADDFAALLLLAADAEVRACLRGPERVQLLWEVCQIPDYRKLLSEHHAALLGEVFCALCGAAGKLDGDFMQRRVHRLEDERGDIETLMMRLEFIRTWSYVANHPHWVADAAEWQERTRAAEDRLSQALHEQLVARFVEAPGRPRRRATAARPATRPAPTGRVAERDDARPGGGSPFEKLAALRARLAREPDRTPPPDAWVEALVAAHFEDLVVGADAAISFRGEPVAQLVRGSDLLHPEVKLSLGRELGAGSHQRVSRRLRAWARDLVSATLGPLGDPRWQRSAALRGLGYQLEQSLGCVPVSAIRGQLRQLTSEDRALLGELGIRRGRRHCYGEGLIEPRATKWRLALCRAYFGQALALGSFEPGAVVQPRPRALVAAPCLALGYAPLGPVLMRVDAVERLDRELGRLAADPPFRLPEGLAAALGCGPTELGEVVLALGYAQTADGFVDPHRRRRRRRSRAAARGT